MKELISVSVDTGRVRENYEIDGPVSQRVIEMSDGTYRLETVLTIGRSVYILKWEEVSPRKAV